MWKRKGFSRSQSNKQDLLKSSYVLGNFLGFLCILIQLIIQSPQEVDTILIFFLYVKKFRNTDVHHPALFFSFPIISQVYLADFHHMFSFGDISVIKAVPVISGLAV